MPFESANPSVVRSVKQRDLLNAWLRARSWPRPRTLPTLRDFQPERMEGEMVDMMSFDVIGGGDRTRFLITQEGARLTATYGSEHIAPDQRTNRYLDDAIGPARYARALPCYLACVTRKRPAYSVTMLRDADGKEVSYERLLLPFGNADHVEHIIGSYKSISIDGSFKFTNLISPAPRIAPVNVVEVVIDLDFVRPPGEPACSDDVIEID
jgi:hypothetical protein